MSTNPLHTNDNVVEPELSWFQASGFSRLHSGIRFCSHPPFHWREIRSSSNWGVASQIPQNHVPYRFAFDWHSVAIHSTGGGRRPWIRRKRHLAKCYWTRSPQLSWSSLLLPSKRHASRMASHSFRCSPHFAPSTISTVILQVISFHAVCELNMVFWRKFGFACFSACENSKWSAI